MADNHNSILKRLSSTNIAPVELEDNKPVTTISRCHEETPVYKALSSLRLSLLFGGLIFKKEFSKTGIKRHLTASRIYSFIVLIFLSFNTFRWLTMFQSNDKFGSSLFMKIALCVYCLQSVTHFMSFVIASETYDRLPDFFLDWEKLRTNGSPTLAYIAFLSNRCTAIVWTIVLGHVGVCTYLIYFTDLQNMQLAPWDEDFEYIFIVRLITIIHQFYLSTSWAASSALMFVICMALAREFQKVSFSIENPSSTKPTKSVADFEAIRQNHQKLCNLVVKADNLLSMQIACGLSGGMLVLCLLLFYVIYDDSVYGNDVALATKIFWITVYIGKVILDCVSGAVLNGAVRGQ